MATEWKLIDPGYSRIRGVCPYIDWALGTGKVGFFPPDQNRRVPVILRLNGISPRQFASGEHFFFSDEDRARWRRRVRVPAIYTERDMGKRSHIICTAIVTRWFFDLLERNDSVLAAVSRVTLGLPLRDESLPPYENDANGTLR